jgi:hypothetical protein
MGLMFSFADLSAAKLNGVLQEKTRGRRLGARASPRSYDSASHTKLLHRRRGVLVRAVRAVD